MNNNEITINLQNISQEDKSILMEIMKRSQKQKVKYIFNVK